MKYALWTPPIGSHARSHARMQSHVHTCTHKCTYVHTHGRHTRKGRCVPACVPTHPRTHTRHPHVILIRTLAETVHHRLLLSLPRTPRPSTTPTTRSGLSRSELLPPRCVGPSINLPAHRPANLCFFIRTSEVLSGRTARH